MKYLQDIVGASFSEAKDLMSQLGFAFNTSLSRYEKGECRVVLVTYYHRDEKTTIDMAKVSVGRENIVFKHGNPLHHFWETNAQESSPEQREKLHETIARQ